MIKYLIIGSALYGFIKIFSEILQNRKHLSDDEISEYKYRRRSLSETNQRRITNHIGTCESCRERFTEKMNQ